MTAPTTDAPAAPDAQGEPDAPLFIGWAATPPADRRFFLRCALGLSAAAGALGWGAGVLQQPPGPGQWNPDAVRDWHGVVTATPYAMLRTRGLDGTPRTVLLSCLGKCGVAARLQGLQGQAVVVRGSLVRRGLHAMLAVDEEGDWIRATPGGDAAADAALRFGTPQPLGAARLEGEVLDAKCWFGAMRPASGKVHKGCASLCIRGGIPPAFLPRPQVGQAGQPGLLLMTDGGRAHGPDLLPFVADAVQLSGQLFRQDDLLLLDAPASALRRV